jgi:hypothetical protein
MAPEGKPRNRMGEEKGIRLKTIDPFTDALMETLQPIVETHVESKLGHLKTYRDFLSNYPGLLDPEKTEAFQPFKIAFESEPLYKKHVSPFFLLAFIAGPSGRSDYAKNLGDFYQKTQRLKSGLPSEVKYAKPILERHEAAIGKWQMQLTRPPRTIRDLIEDLRIHQKIGMAAHDFNTFQLHNYGVLSKNRAYPLLPEIKIRELNAGLQMRLKHIKYLIRFLTPLLRHKDFIAHEDLMRAMEPELTREKLRLDKRRWKKS